MELKDCLHFYLGCEVENAWFPEGHSERANGWKLTGYVSTQGKPYRLENEEDYTWSDQIKIKLRPLSDMTEEEFGVLFRLSIGTHQDHSLGEIKRMGTNEVYIRQGYAQFIFGYERGYDNDVRVPQGYSFYIKRSLIKDELVVSEKGMETKESWYNNTELVIAQNQTEIFSQLLKWQFDLYNLIESSQAIATSKNK